MVKKIIQNLLHKELSYQVHGAAIEVRKDFGPGHKEKLYQEAFGKELKRRNIYFKKEVPLKIYSPKDGEYIGLYRPDFIVDEKIIVEIKAEKFDNRDEIKRIYDYLRNSKYELAYFINFASSKLFIKRIIYTNDRKPFFKNLLVSISLILVLFSGLPVSAATIFFDAPGQEIGLNKEFKVGAFLNTEGEPINAVEGKVIFPADLLELKEIRDGNSVINFWVEKPRSNSDGQIIFSGITPGGYQGEKGLLFSLIFLPKKEGQFIIDLKEAKTLLNDGQGTEASLSISPYQFTIAQPVSPAPAVPQAPLIIDREPPESFVPEIAKDKTLFEGKWFVVFATQDKLSGIDHYEIKETRNKELGRWFSRWRVAESPYVLKDQELRSYIFVKAVDKTGNERIVKLSPQNQLRWYENYENWIILIIIVIFAAYFLVRAFKVKLKTENEKGKTGREN